MDFNDRKDRYRPSIIAIKERCSNSKFSFSYIEKTDVFFFFLNFQVDKDPQDSDTPTKLKDSFWLSADFTLY